MRCPGQIKIFPRVRQEIFSIERNFIGDYVTHFTFSLSFPGFSFEIQIFPEILIIFQIPEFIPEFPGLWPPCLRNKEAL